MEINVVSNKEETTPKDASTYCDQSKQQTTPVNRKRSFVNRRNHSSRRQRRTSLNITNLNILFDSSSITQSSKQPNIHITKNESDDDGDVTIVSDRVNEKITETPKTIRQCNADFQLAFLTPNLYNMKIKSSSTPINVDHLESADIIKRKFLKTSLLQSSPNNFSLNNDIKIDITPIKTTNNLVDSKLQKSFLNNSISKKINNFEVDENNRTISTFDTILKCVKRTSRHWTNKLIGFCNNRAINWIRPFSTANFVANNKSCQCDLYKQKIDDLNKRIDELKIEMDIRQQQNIENFNNLNKKIEELINASKVMTVEKVQTVGAPLPPPPPPPPPPSLFLVQTKQLKVPNKTDQSKNSNSEKENNKSRPLITLDDLLKVKLKKPADRPKRLLCNKTDPAISLDVLKQIKLKPASSRATSEVRDNVSTSSLTTSPCSTSLNRLLLKNSISNYENGKIKRLQRRRTINSFDLQLGKRERD